MVGDALRYSYRLSTDRRVIDDELWYAYSIWISHFLSIIFQPFHPLSFPCRRLCAGATHEKTYTALWLLGKLKSLPERKRPRGFMVSGGGRRQGEDYASFLARSLKLDPNIEPESLANLIVVAPS
jgi:hypothetical protein